MFHEKQNHVQSFNKFNCSNVGISIDHTTRYELHPMVVQF